ncbi:uracil-DNA glycosylase [Collimonas sp.]|jgi:uracil-DNA glycosylase family 4|uniref:uracil-DNA glycosylase n=1 Tax=Collimonas sp. TaxID=1963772 RepID=UPI002BF27F0B|nr:uracil-DNA glycosylase [Collimonas sp.]HWW05190.1 uracil-DNA glycosylase [Collimonas sp.]
MSQMTRRSVFLDEIGLGPLWLRRDGAVELPGTDLIDADIALEQTFAPAAEILAAPTAVLQQEPRAEVATVAAVATQGHSAPVNKAAVSAWGDDDESPSSPIVSIAIADSPAAMDWHQLQKAVAGCTACGLCHGRKNTVFGVGDSKAKWLFIGEGPGRNEDIQGEPFVGPAGKLLDNILLAMGLKRGENAYIANIVKCRPTDGTGRDRPPAADEVAACLPYLQRQIELIQPTILVALGKTAALSLLGLDPATPVSKLRGTVYRYADRPLVVTYHPAYLLRQLADKGKVWSDLCLAMSAFANVDANVGE